MEQREDVLREALTTNEQEKERWTNFVKENETAIENLNEFSKHLTVDVMVPVGRLALIPGQLIHTNEVLVGHYQGYFSQCSAHKAKEICELRTRGARDHLKKLEVEAEFFQNKLEKPYLEGVLPTSEQREIIEEYDEEREKVWRERHKLMLKRAKLKEKEQKELIKETNLENELIEPIHLENEEVLLRTLDERGLLEESEKELENTENFEGGKSTNEIVSSLRSGQIELPPQKKRISHVTREKVHKDQEEEHARVVKKTDVNTSTPKTNNNNTPNPEIAAQITTVGADNEDDDDDAEDSEELPQEVRLIVEQAKYLKAADQIGFYEYQIQIVRKKLSRLPLKRNKDIEEKIKLIDLIDCLQQLLEAAEDAAEEEENKSNEVNDEINENLWKNAETTGTGTGNNDLSHADQQDNSTMKPQKRRISFSTENDTLEFLKNETVTQMVQRNTDKKKTTARFNKLMDDSIKNPTEREKTTVQASMDKKTIIMDRVKQNLEFVSENQSQLQYNLLDFITNSEEANANTLTMHFQHSKQNAEVKKKGEQVEKEGSVPGSPSDIYENYLQLLKSQVQNKPTTIYLNGYEGEEMVKVPTLGEKDRAMAYEDPRKKFSQAANEKSINENTNVEHPPIKSILRNKDAVKNEARNEALHDQLKNLNLNKKKKKFQEEEYMSAYNKVMHDVVEKPITEPDPLPAENFIDMHAPKKRISHFKKSRTVQS